MTTNNTSNHVASRATEIGHKALSDFKSANSSNNRGIARTIAALVFAHEDGLFDDPIRGRKVDLTVMYQSPGSRTDQGERLNRVVELLFDGMYWNEDSAKKNKWELVEGVTDGALAALKKCIQAALPIVAYLIRDHSGKVSVTSQGKLQLPFSAMPTKKEAEKLKAKEVVTDGTVTLNNMSHYGVRLTVAQLGRVAKEQLGLVNAKGPDQKKSGEGFSLKTGTHQLASALSGADKEILKTVKADTQSDMRLLFVSLCDIFASDGKGGVDVKKVKAVYEEFMAEVESKEEGEEENIEKAA